MRSFEIRMEITAALVEKTHSYWLCIRARISRAIIFPYATLIATFVASRGIPPIAPAMMATGAGLLIALAIYISNDVADLETDMANLVTRPVAQRKVLEKDALTLSAMLYLAGVTLGSLVNLATLFLCILGVIIGIIYSFSPIRLKRRFLLKQVAVASGGLIASLTGGAAVNRLSSSVMFAGFIFFTYAMAAVPIVDLGDIIGDRKEGRRTLPLVLGPRYTVRLAISIIVAIMIAGMLGYLQMGFNVALPILGSIACILFIYTIYPLFSRWNDQAYCRKLVNKITLLHFLLQFAIALGSIYI
jgi:4-hydroxybenzoate polyprenyltransferase